MPDYQQFFEKLTAKNHSATSPQTPTYNCIGWAAGDDSRWWEPNYPVDLGYYWPAGVPSDMQVDSLVAAFATLGFEECEDGAVEAGIEKLAIYFNGDGHWTHASRQLPNGRWTSKLGRLEDIEHESAEALTGSAYGEIYCFMKRKAY